MRRAGRGVGGFWAAQTVTDGIGNLSEAGIDSPFAQLATQARNNFV